MVIFLNVRFSLNVGKCNVRHCTKGVHVPEFQEGLASSKTKCY